MNQEDAAYIAGFLDGEGSISLGRNHYFDPKRTTVYSVLVRIGNTNKDVLDWICAVSGFGKVYTQKNSGTFKSNQKFWMFTITKKDAVGKFLSEIYPYLKVKRLQAEIALKYVETIREDRFRGQKTPEPTVTYRDGLVFEMKEANSHKSFSETEN